MLGFTAFISHSSKDKPFVRKLTTDLALSDVSVWLDEEQILGGQSITERLADGLAQSKHLIIVLSENFLNSPWCKTELRTILHKQIKSREKKIIPVQIGHLPDTCWNEFPLIFMEDILRINMSGHTYKAGLPKLLDALNANPQSPLANLQVPLESRIKEMMDISRIRLISYSDAGLMHVFKFNALEFTEDERGSDRLAFITEQQVHYIHWTSGVCINFSLRNNHDRALTVCGIEADVMCFFDEHSLQFAAFKEQVPARSAGLSAPIPTYMLKVRLSRNPEHTQARVITVDDSAESRGIISPFNRFREVAENEVQRFSQMINISKASDWESGANAVPPSCRFMLKPDESDAFHCQVTGQENGIYVFRFRISFHYADEKAVSFSDCAYVCFSTRRA